MPLSHPVSPKNTEGPGNIKTVCQQDPFSKALRPAMNDLEVALLSPNHWQDRLYWEDWKKTQWSMINKCTYDIIPATWTFVAPYRYDARRFLQSYPGHVLAASFCWHFVGFRTVCTHASSGDGSCPRLFPVLDALTYPACSHAVKRDCLNWLPLEKTSWRRKKTYLEC